MRKPFGIKLPFACIWFFLFAGLLFESFERKVYSLELLKGKHIVQDASVLPRQFLLLGKTKFPLLCPGVDNIFIFLSMNHFGDGITLSSLACLFTRLSSSSSFFREKMEDGDVLNASDTKSIFRCEIRDGKGTGRSTFLIRIED